MPVKPISKLVNTGVVLAFRDLQPIPHCLTEHATASGRHTTATRTSSDTPCPALSLLSDLN